MKRAFFLAILFFFLLYLLKEPIYNILIRTDNNLEEVSLHSEEDYQKLKQEYETLLNYTSKEENAIISRIVLRSPYTFFEVCTVLKGKEEGVKKGDAIYNEQGLIGVITEVHAHSSIASFLYDKTTLLRVKVGDMFGLLVSENETLKIKDLLGSLEVEVGSPVYTAEESSLPSNLLVGTVKEIIKTNNNLSTELIIEPAVDFNHLNYIYIKGVESYE